MFKQLLLPLDGSNLAESVFPIASYLAEKLGASIKLFHVIEVNAPAEIHGEQHLSKPEQANDYLEKVSKHGLFRGMKVEWHVHTSEVGDVAKSIVEHSVEFKNDLIVMSTHGSGGLRDALFGSIAQQVISFGKRPVLIIKPSSEKVSFRIKNVLIALDGDPEHEKALAIASDLAHACGASLHLLMVVHTFGTIGQEWKAISRMLPGTTSRMLEMGERNAEEYLDKHLKELQKRDLHVTASVSRGEPADIIVSVAAEREIDIIVLGTHGKIGTEAFWAGSVAPKICKHCKIGLLLIPVANGTKLTKNP